MVQRETGRTHTHSHDSRDGKERGALTEIFGQNFEIINQRRRDCSLSRVRVNGVNNNITSPRRKRRGDGRERGALTEIFGQNLISKHTSQ